MTYKKDKKCNCYLKKEEKVGESPTQFGLFVIIFVGLLLGALITQLIK